MADKLLDIPTVADLLGVSRMTVYRCIHADRLKAVNIGGGAKRTKLRVSEKAYADFVKAGTL